MSAIHSAQLRLRALPADCDGAGYDPTIQPDNWIDVLSGDDLDLDLDDVGTARDADHHPRRAGPGPDPSPYGFQFSVPPSPSPSRKPAATHYTYTPGGIKTPTLSQKRQHQPTPFPLASPIRPMPAFNLGTNHKQTPKPTPDMSPVLPRRLVFTTTTSASASASMPAPAPKPSPAIKPAPVQTKPSSSSSHNSAASTTSATSATGSLTPRASVINPLATAAAAAAAASSAPAATPDHVFRTPGAPASAYRDQNQQLPRRAVPPRTPVKESQPSFTFSYPSQPWSASAASNKKQLPPPVTPTHPSQSQSQSSTQSYTHSHAFTLPATTPTKPSTSHPPVPDSPFSFHSPPQHLRHRHRIQRRTKVPPRTTPPPPMFTSPPEPGCPQPPVTPEKDRSSRWSCTKAAARKRARDTLSRSVSRSRSRSARGPPFVATPTKGTPVAAAPWAWPIPGSAPRSRTSNASTSSISTRRSAAGRQVRRRRRSSRVSNDGLRMLVVPSTPFRALKRVSLPRRLAPPPPDMYAHAAPLGLTVQGVVGRRWSKVRTGGAVRRVSLTGGLGVRRRSKIKAKKLEMDPNIPRYDHVKALAVQGQNRLWQLGMPEPVSPRKAARAHAPAPHQHVPNTGLYYRTARAAHTQYVRMYRGLLSYVHASQPPASTSAAPAAPAAPFMRSASQPLPAHTWSASSWPAPVPPTYARALPPGPVGRTSLQMRVPGSGNPKLMADYYHSLCTWTGTHIGAGGRGTIIVGHGSKLSLLDAALADEGLEHWQTMHVDVGQVTAVEAHAMDELLVAVGSKDSQVLWVDVVTEEVVGRASVTTLVDARDLTGLASPGGRGHVCAAKWSPVDPALCAVGTHRGDLVILDTRAPTSSASVGALVVPGAHGKETCGLAWHAGGKHLASGSFDQAVCLWDLRFLRTGAGGAATHRPIADPQDELTLNAATAKALAWCPWDANVLAIGGGATGMCVSVWDAMGSKQVQHRIATQSQVTHVHWSDVHRELVATLGISNHEQDRPGFAVFASAQFEYADVGKVAHLGKPLAAPVPTHPRLRARPVHVCYSPCGRVTFTVDTYGRMVYYRLFDEGWDAGYECKLIETKEQGMWREGEEAEGITWRMQKEMDLPIGVPVRWWPWEEDELEEGEDEKAEPFVPVWPDVEQEEDERQWEDSVEYGHLGRVGRVAASGRDASRWGIR